MRSFKDIERYLNDVEPILIDLKIGLYNSKYLGTLEKEDEIWASKHGFFINYVTQMKFVCSIQLCKLLDDNENQKLNFFKFLRRIESDFRIKENKVNVFDSRKEKFFYENLKEIKDEIPSMLLLIRQKIDDKRELIQKLKDARDKIYAHTDPTGKDKFISWKEVYNLSILAIEIYNILNEELTFTTLHLEMLEPWSPKWIIERIAKTRNNPR
jgi:hypothetical protein